MNNFPLNFLIVFNNYLELHPEILLLLTTWTIIWKGLALWKSAQRKEKSWFVILLILNTLGLLDILYLFVFSKVKESLSLKNIEEDKKGSENIKNND